jgi:hypothetical protein
VKQLKPAPQVLYRAFEAKLSLTKAALHSEIYPRMREAAAKERWAAVRKIIDEVALGRIEHERKIAAANIRCCLAASTWYYYRFHFGFSLRDSISCAETTIHQSIESISKFAEVAQVKNNGQGLVPSRTEILRCISAPALAWLSLDLLLRPCC